MKKYSVLKNKLNLNEEGFSLKEEKGMFIFYDQNGKIKTKFIRLTNGEVYSEITFQNEKEDLVVKEKRDPLILEAYISASYSPDETIRKIYKSEKHKGVTLVSYERKDGKMTPVYFCFSKEKPVSDWVDIEITNLSVFSEDKIISLSEDYLSNSLRSGKGVSELSDLFGLGIREDQTEAISQIINKCDFLREDLFGSEYNLHPLPENEFNTMIKEYGSMPFSIYQFFEQALTEEYPFEISENAIISDFLNSILRNIIKAKKHIKK